MAGGLTAVKPREYNYPIILGLSNGAAPPGYLFLQFLPALRLHFSETGRMVIQSASRSDIRPGIWHEVDDANAGEVHAVEEVEQERAEEEEGEERGQEEGVGEGADDDGEGSSDHEDNNHGQAHNSQSEQ